MGKKFVHCKTRIAVESSRVSTRARSLDVSLRVENVSTVRLTASSGIHRVEVKTARTKSDNSFRLLKRPIRIAVAIKASQAPRERVKMSAANMVKLKTWRMSFDLLGIVTVKIRNRQISK